MDAGAGTFRTLSAPHKEIHPNLWFHPWGLTP